MTRRKTRLRRCRPGSAAESWSRTHRGYTLEKQKTELENTDYVAIARSFHLTPQQLAEFLKSQQAAPSGDGPLQKQEDMNED